MNTLADVVHANVGLNGHHRLVTSTAAVGMSVYRRDNVLPVIVNLRTVRLGGPNPAPLMVMLLPGRAADVGSDVNAMGLVTVSLVAPVLPSTTHCDGYLPLAPPEPSRGDHLHTASEMLPTEVRNLD